MRKILKHIKQFFTYIFDYLPDLGEPSCYCDCCKHRRGTGGTGPG